MNKLLETLSEKEKKLLEYRLLITGEILFNEDEACEYVGIVLNGRVDIVSYSFQGQEIIYNILYENNIFGNNLIFSSEPKYRGTVIAKKKSKIALISKKNLIYLLSNNVSFLTLYLNIQSDFGKHLNQQIKLLSFIDAEERFLFYLSSCDNRITFTSVTSLAASLFLARETVSRLISKLEKEDRIIRNKNTIIWKANS